MNKNEEIVYKYLKYQGYKPIRMSYNKPDFFIECFEFYVEVKSLDNFKSRLLSNNQEREFSKIKKPIYIYYVKKGKIIGKRKFEPLETLPKLTRAINETFEDKEFDFLKKTKGDKTWRRFILELVNYPK